MRIALDVSPVRNHALLSHRVRGVGFYINNLITSLKKYVPQNEYIFIDGIKSQDAKVDVLHIPYFEPFFLNLPHKKTVKTIVTVHDLTPLVFPKNFPSGIKGKIKWGIQKRRLKSMDAIITDSMSSKKDIIRHAGVPEDKIHVVYLAAGEEFGPKKVTLSKRKSLQSKYNIPESFFLYVGDATWNKNLPRIIEACNIAGVNLVMVGKALKEEVFDTGNPWNKDLILTKRMIKESPNIYALGFVDTLDLVFLYNMTAALIMPSIYEGFGLPLVEAMQCGCPVITSREGSLDEVGGQAPLYVSARDSGDIAEGIKKIASDHKFRSDLSQKSLAQAKNFSWRQTALQTAEIYNSIK